MKLNKTYFAGVATGLSIALAALFVFNGRFSSSPALTPEELKAAGLHLQDAKRFYVKGKYSACLDSLASLRAVTPQFEDSDEVATLCGNGETLAFKVKAGRENRD